MNKKLTVNHLAIGNLKARKKQYAIMIIGIILAMVFTSSIVFFYASATETAMVNSQKSIGYQDCIIACEDYDADDYNKLKSTKWIDSFGFAHAIGVAYTTNENVNCLVAWLDDEAMEKSNQIFLEGVYPSKENEVAIERTQLLNLGYTKAKLGDTIKLNIKTKNGLSSFGKEEKEYTLVGIVSDKASNILRDYSSGENGEVIIPSVFVAQNTPVKSGGKELVLAYTNYSNEATKEAEKRIKESNSEEWWDEVRVITNYIDSVSNDKHEYNYAHALTDKNLRSPNELMDGGDMLVFVIIVLVFASCVAIINSFNSNLKDRKQQIGMMRAVGATKRQIIKIYGREAFIISLIATPISIVISYLIVRLVLNFVSNDAVMSKSIKTLPIAALFNIVIVMLAAFIPLESASRITPMQAIRNTKNNRKAKTKKIKSKVQFNASKLWADRSRLFYKGSHITVSIILATTVCFTCVSSSIIVNEKEHINSLPADYFLYDYNGGGISKSEYQQLYAKPYVEKISGEKNTDICMLVDEYDDFLYSLKHGELATYNWGEGEDHYEINSVDDYIQKYQEGIEKGVLFGNGGYNSQHYQSKKQQLKLDKEMFDFSITGAENETIMLLEDKVIDGKINLEKLSSGEEVIMVAPQIYEARVRVLVGGGIGSTDVCDDEIKKKEFGYKTVVQSECPYKAGDTIELLKYTGQSVTNDEYKVDDSKRKTVKIGAIIRPNDITTEIGSISQFGILTNIQGFDIYSPNSNYYKLSINSPYDLDEETNIEIMEDMAFITANGDRWLESKYEYLKWQKEQYQTLMLTMICVTVIGFAICASIINNSLTSRIRESKKVIGTLRTVGADRVALVKSFVIQMLSMFGFGVGIGYALYLLAYFALNIASSNVLRLNLRISFSPWFAIIMTVIMFVVCSVNLWSKISKEMKNSIVDNIREL